MATYKTALKIYNDLCDMDFNDYQDSREQDIQYIINLLQTIGENATRTILTTF